MSQEMSRQNQEQVNLQKGKQGKSHVEKFMEQNNENVPQNKTEDYKNQARFNDMKSTDLKKEAHKDKQPGKDDDQQNKIQDKNQKDQDKNEKFQDKDEKDQGEGFFSKIGHSVMSTMHKAQEVISETIDQTTDYLKQTIEEVKEEQNKDLNQKVQEQKLDQTKGDQSDKEKDQNKKSDQTKGDQFDKDKDQSQKSDQNKDKDQFKGSQINMNQQPDQVQLFNKNKTDESYKNQTQDLQQNPKFDLNKGGQGDQCQSNKNQQQEKRHENKAGDVPDKSQQKEVQQSGQEKSVQNPQELDTRYQFDKDKAKGDISNKIQQSDASHDSQINKANQPNIIGQKDQQGPGTDFGSRDQQVKHDVSHTQKGSDLTSPKIDFHIKKDDIKEQEHFGSQDKNEKSKHRQTDHQENKLQDKSLQTGDFQPDASSSSQVQCQHHDNFEKDQLSKVKETEPKNKFSKDNQMSAHTTASGKFDIDHMAKRGKDDFPQQESHMEKRDKKNVNTQEGDMREKKSPVGTEDLRDKDQAKGHHEGTMLKNNKIKKTLKLIIKT
jgi:hypothetical protein